MSSAFIFYESFEAQLNELDDATKLRFYMAISAYALHGTSPGFKGIELAVWIPIQDAIDRAQDRRDARVEAGKHGGRPQKSGESKNNQAKPKETYQNQDIPEVSNAFPAGKQDVDVDVGVYVDDDVDKKVGGYVDAPAEASDDVDKPVENHAPHQPTNTGGVTNDALDDWLSQQDLLYDNLTVISIKNFLQVNSLDIMYLDYVLETLGSRKNYKDKPYDDKRRLFRAAVCEWSDLLPGYADWANRHNKRQRLDRYMSPPQTCTECGSPLDIIGGNPVCPKCKAFWTFDDGQWTVNKTLDQSLTLPQYVVAGQDAHT